MSNIKKKIDLYDEDLLDYFRLQAYKQTDEWFEDEVDCLCDEWCFSSQDAWNRRLEEMRKLEDIGQKRGTPVRFGYAATTSYSEGNFCYEIFVQR